MTSELLTVAALPTAAEAEIVRGRLREAGVEAVLVEPETGANAAAPARIHVRVTPADFERAMRVVFPIPMAVGNRQQADKEQAVGSRQQADEEQAVGSRQQAVKAEENRQRAMPDVVQEVPDPRPLTPDPSLNPDRRPPTPDPFLNPDPRPLNAHPAPNPIPTPQPRPMMPQPEPLHIVVPAMEFLTTGSRIKTIEPTAIVDRAAKRAWWCTVAGIGICPVLLYPAWWTAIIAALALPALGYSVCVVHSIGLRNQALSRTGDRHFYGALVLIALFIALTFASMAMRQ